MKTMTCKQLGGACDEKFQGETFEEIADLSKAHGMEMMLTQDEKHLDAMNKMRELMQDPQAMQDWYEGKKKEFEELEED